MIVIAGKPVNSVRIWKITECKKFHTRDFSKSDTEM